jgi:hypothetical protein
VYVLVKSVTRVLHLVQKLVYLLVLMTYVRVNCLYPYLNLLLSQSLMYAGVCLL